MILQDINCKKKRVVWDMMMEKKGKVKMEKRIMQDFEVYWDQDEFEFVEQEVGGWGVNEE